MIFFFQKRVTWKIKEYLRIFSEIGIYQTTIKYLIWQMSVKPGSGNIGVLTKTT